jgi:single-strand DNA-binding protein
MANSIQLVGYVGQAASVTKTNSGRTLMKLTVADNRSYQVNGVDESGNTVKVKKDDVIWFNVEAWHSAALAPYLYSGRLVEIKGRVDIREFTDRSGGKAYWTCIVAREINVLGPKDDQKVAQARASYAPAPEYPQSLSPQPAANQSPLHIPTQAPEFEEMFGDNGLRIVVKSDGYYVQSSKRATKSMQRVYFDPAQKRLVCSCNKGPGCEHIAAVVSTAQRS